MVSLLATPLPISQNADDLQAGQGPAPPSVELRVRLISGFQIRKKGLNTGQTLKKSKDGALYYDHVILKVTKQNRPLAEPGVRSPGVQESVFAVVDGIKTVGQLAEKVKALRPELDIAHSQVIDANGEPMVVEEEYDQGVGTGDIP